MPNSQEPKLCEFSFWPSDKMVQYVCDASISDEIEHILEQQLKADGIQARIIKQEFTKEECDRLCTPEQLQIITPRYSSRNTYTQIDITAANKADGIKYVQDKLGVSDNEVLASGDGLNDKSLVDMTRQGSVFICLANAMEGLKRYVTELRQQSSNPFSQNLIMVQNAGAAGIAEGIESIFKRFRPDLLT